MATVEYVLPLGENARKRHWHETSKGKVVMFVVQLEVFCDGAWHPVVRYDSAHEFSHIDSHRRTGETRKEPLPFSYAEMMTIADEDIKANWETYRDRFLHGEWP